MLVTLQVSEFIKIILRAKNYALLDGSWVNRYISDIVKGSGSVYTTVHEAIVRETLADFSIIFYIIISVHK